MNQQPFQYDINQQADWAIERLEAKVPSKPKPVQPPEQTFGGSVITWLCNAAFFLVKWAFYLFLASMFLPLVPVILLALVADLALASTGGLQQFSGKRYPIMKGRAGRDYG